MTRLATPANDTPPAARLRLRLRTVDLPASDRVKLQVFLRLGSDRLTCAWSLDDGEDGQVLLYIGDTAPALPGRTLALRVVEAGTALAGTPGTVTRPLEYENVLDMLAQAESRLMPQVAPSMPSGSAGAADTSGSAPAPESASATPPSHDTSALAAVTAPRAGTATAPVSTPPSPSKTSGPPHGALAEALRDGDRYRLRRWPDSTLIQQDRDHLRIASFLSARALAVDDLARLANVAATKCESFLRTLLGLGILDVHGAASTPSKAASSTAWLDTEASNPAGASVGASATNPATAPATGAAPKAPSATTSPVPPATRSNGLFGRIRRKLGLAF